MYNSIYELPSEVNDALGPDDRVVWYEAYNKCDPHTEDEVYEAKKSAWRACMDLPSSFSFKIIASADAVDIDHEIIDVPSVKASMDSFIKAGGNLNFNHSNYRVGVVYDWEPIDVDGAEGIAVYGNLFGNNLVAKSVRERFVKGANSLSIAGEADKGRYMCDDKGCYTRRQVAPNGLMEISITSNPANKACTLIDYHEGKSFAKSAGSRVMEYTIHKTYDECPILKLKKAFMDCGIEAHARENGVFLPMDNIGFAKAAPIMKAAGLVYEQVDGGAMANYRDFALERSFKKASDEGLIDGNGVFTGGLTSDTFRKAVDDGLVYFRNGEFRYIEPTGWDAIFKEVRKSRAAELFGEEGQKAIDENGQQKLGIHWNAVNEGVSGMNGANMHAQTFNPELFTPMSGPLLRRDQKQGYYDAIATPNKHDKKYTDAERAYKLNNPTGFTTELYPDAKVLHLRSPKDWYDTGLYDKVSSWEDLAEYYDVIDYDGFSPNFDVRGRIGYPKDGREAARMSNEALNGAQIRHRWLKNQDPGVDLDREILSATSRNHPPSIKSSSARIILNPYAVMNSRLVTRGEDGTAYVDGVPVSKLSPRVTEWKPYDREAALQKLGELYIKAGITPRWYKPKA